MPWLNISNRIIIICKCQYSYYSIIATNSSLVKSQFSTIAYDMPGALKHCLHVTDNHLVNKQQHCNRKFSKPFFRFWINSVPQRIVGIVLKRNTTRWIPLGVLLAESFTSDSAKLQLLTFTQFHYQYRLLCNQQRQNTHAHQPQDNYNEPLSPAIVSSVKPALTLTIACLSAVSTCIYYCVSQ